MKLYPLFFKILIDIVFKLLVQTLNFFLLMSRTTRSPPLVGQEDLSKHETPVKLFFFACFISFMVILFSFALLTKFYEEEFSVEIPPIFVLSFLIGLLCCSSCFLLGLCIPLQLIISKGDEPEVGCVKLFCLTCLFVVLIGCWPGIVGFWFFNVSISFFCFIIGIYFTFAYAYEGLSILNSFIVMVDQVFSLIPQLMEE